MTSAAQPASLPQPPPEAILIKRARQARGISPEDAAMRTTVIKSRRWRQIEGGHDRGRPVRGDDDVIAHMASVVGVSPEQLAGVGRTEAAEVLREIGRQSARRPAAASMLDVAPDELPQVRAFLEGLRHRGAIPPPEDVAPECEHERRILRGPGPAEMKRLQILAHREEGHDSFCDPDEGVPIGPRGASLSA